LNLYVESSAALSWLLSEDHAEEVRQTIASAEIVISSELTLIECDRALVRGVALAVMTEAAAADLRRLLAQAAEHWDLLRLDQEIIERARRPFPREPIRTLDAIHLASAIIARSLVPGIGLLSLDQKIRECAQDLGFEVLPG